MTAFEIIKSGDPKLFTNCLLKHAFKVNCVGE